MPTILPFKNGMKPYGQMGWLGLLLLLAGVVLALLLFPFGGNGS
jgi:hypothetical protein